MMDPTADFTLADFQRQLHQIKKLGSMGQILKMIPGLGNMANMLADMNPDQDMTRIDGIINSMTPWEREHPEQIDSSRRNRIAQGSGTDPADINKLIKDFGAMSGMMKGMAGMGLRDRKRAVNDPESDAPLRPWWLFWQRRPPSVN